MKELFAEVVKYLLIVVFTCMYTVMSLIGWFKMRNKPSREIDLTTEPSCLSDPTLGKHGTVRLAKRDVEIHFVAKGDRSKPLMLFVHGFPEFWYSWRNQLIEFGGNDYYAVAMDMTGYGGSSKPAPTERYATIEIAEDVKEFILELGYTKCILVGHDWGATVSFTVASNFPEVVDKLIIMNGPSSRGMKRCMNFTQLMKSSYMYFFQVPYLSEFFFERDHARVLSLFNRQKKVLSNEEMDTYRYMFSKGGFTAPFNYYRNAFKKPTRKLQYDIHAPTLIIWGTGDSVLGTEIAAASAKDCRQVEIKYVEGATHWINQECPDQVNTFIREYLRN